MRARSFLRFSILTGAGLCLGLLATFMALFLFLQTDTGRAYIASKLSRLLSSEPDTVVTVERAQGLIPFCLDLGRVTISDGKGPWLEVRDIHISWSPLALLRGRISIGNASASAVRLDRIPESSATEETESGDPLSILSEFPPVEVGRLSIMELAVGKLVTGRAAAFRVEGSLNPKEREHGVEASLVLEGTGETSETRLHLGLASLVNPVSVTLTVEFHESDGGWVASALGLEEAGSMDLSFTGDGPISAWKGSLQGNVQEFGSVQSSVDIRSSNEGTQLAVTGTCRVSESFPSAEIASLIGKRNRFELAANISPSRTVSVGKAEFNSESARLSAAGTFDFAGRRIDGKWTFSVDGLEMLMGRVGKPVAGSLAIEGSFGGTIERPVGAASARLHKFRFDRFSAEELKMDVRVRTLETAGNQAEKVLGIEGTGSVNGLSLTEEKPFPFEAVDWSFNLEFPIGGNITVNSLRFETAGYLVEANGTIDPGGPGATIETSLMVKDPNPKGEARREKTREALKIANIGFHLNRNVSTGAVSLAVEGRVMHMEHISMRLPPFIGSECTARGAFELLGKSHLTVSTLRVESDHLSFQTQADVDFSRKTGKVIWRFAVPRLGCLGPALGTPLAGNFEAEGTVEGPFHAPQSRSTLKVSNLEIHGRKVERFLATVIARDLFSDPRGTVQMDLRHAGQSLLASSGFSVRGKRLGLSSISVKAPGTSVAGNLAVDFETRALDGSLRGNLTDLAALGRLVGEPLEGSAAFDIRLNQEKGGQAVKLVLKGSRISTRYGSIKAASVLADLSGIFDIPSGNMQVRVDDFERPGILLKSLRFKTSGDRRAMGFEGAAKGRASKKFSVQTRGAAAFSKGAVRVRLELFKGDFGKHSFTLLKPAGFERTAETFAVEDLAVRAGSGQLNLSGRTTPRTVSINGDFEKVPLGLLSTFGGPSLPGLVAGRISIEGKPSRPSGSFTLKVTDIFTPGLSPETVRGAFLACEGNYNSGRMDIGFGLTCGEDRPVTGNLEIPLEISFTPFSLSVPSEGSIAGGIEAQTDLATVTAVLPIEGHRFAGRLAGSVELGGTVAKPSVSGRASVTDGAYENYTLGTVLKNVKAVVAGKGNRIELEEFDATDGEKGAVSASGWARMESGNSFPLEIQASMSSARLIRRGDSTAVAKGNASLSGTSRSMSLSGDIEIESAEFNIPKHRSIPITSLKVIDVYGPGKSPPARSTEAEENGDGPSSSRLGFDVRIVLPGRSFLRGQGLNSEWKGRFRLRGSASSPSLVGQLSVVRGTYQFLGQSFNIVNGVIQFDGTTPPNPLLDVTAQVETGDIKAKVILTGLVSSPDIKLQSEPSLPNDEIMARILFKRSLNQINPTQALKIAAALSGLAGEGSVFDFVERTRGFLGLDQLELRQPEDGKEGVAVAIGKYLTDQIYVDVQKDVGGAGAAVEVEVEVSPHITFGSKVGTDARKGLEINWKKDY